MTTLLYTHPACIDHDPGIQHPECPDRLRSVMEGFALKEFDALQRIKAPMIDIADIEKNHHPTYVAEIFDKMPTEGRVYLDPDTAMSPSSGEASRRSAGAFCDAIDKVLSGEADNAFCAVRPPGHHAESNQAMGFCLFNSIAIGAKYARKNHGLKRVAVVDFDVHHGNGTQHSLESDSGMFYASSHQSPAYPGTGLVEERGEFNNICNFPMSPGEGSRAFRKGYQNYILPALRAFKPELLLISAGFDAHERDPLAQINLKTDDYDWVTGELLSVAVDHCGGNVVSLLEGGYDLGALKKSSQAHVRVLMHA
jgi:acetoin utilization deacetylase AcuC-like enzyme